MERAGRLAEWQARFDRWHVPALVGLVSAALAVLVSHALAMREQNQFGLLVEAGARRVRSEIRAGLDSRMHAMSILAREWQDRLLPMRGDWESDVRLILSQSPGLQSIAWIEADGERSWEYPPETILPALDLEALRAEGTALRRPVVIGPVLPPGREPRLRILAPLVESGSPRGWLAAAYTSRALFADILVNADTTYAVDVAAGDVELYRAAAAGAADRIPHAATHTALALPGGLTIQIGVGPSDEMLTAADSYLPRATLAGGLVLSVLLFLALGLRNVASQRARALEVEIAGHAHAEAEIRRLNAELEQRVLERTAELSRSNDDLQRFASFLSHELRQPLGTQMICIDLLESTAADALDEAARQHMANIRASAVKMAELISAQIALSSSTNAIAARDRVELASVVRDAISDVSPDLDAVGAKVRVGALPVVHGDARQLYQLFRNLLENAIKYRRDDVTSEIAIDSRTASGSALPDGCEILVEDNGRGFAREDAERIFEPSQRLEANGADGQGLGLAICRTIVERHGGRLCAEGRPGEGATFRIALPRDRIYQ